MDALCFTTAPVKQYEAALHNISEKKLPVWVHNRAIRKAVESYCIKPGEIEL